MTNHTMQERQHNLQEKHHNTVQVFSCGTLNGTSVENLEGEDLGHLKEIMLDMNSGRVAYAVLSFGGVLGIGDKLFAVPWAALHIDTYDKKIVLDVARDRLEEAPGFDKDNWPHTVEHSWLNDVYDYYGHTYMA
ncbi:MAG: PRC-barrel domain-containing protein [Chloroflexota bacterium]